ncbi:MAG: DUF2892 domain-containing protein [Nitrospiraceae bacterium]|nr:DUF2892 domain-containing protein [Nitrospiraceae bacterium]
MKKNMAMLDRILRAAIAVVIAALYYAGAISGTLAAVLGVVAVIFLGTSIVGFCPIYALLGISTLRHKKDEGAHTTRHA